MRFGRTLFNFLGGTQFAADMDDALERISPFIRRGDAERVRDLDKKIVAVPEHAKDYEDMGDLLDEVLTALLYQNPATATYARPTGEPRRPSSSTPTRSSRTGRASTCSRSTSKPTR